MREWKDKTGQFRVDAALLDYKDGKLKLHKKNGVIIEVSDEKMSPEDIEYVKRTFGKKSQSSPAPAAALPRRSDDDDIPLDVRRESLAAAKKNKRPTTDWFEFFLNAGCGLDDCDRYAKAFERDNIDESLLADISESTMRSLGLREGDIIRAKKAIEKKFPKADPAQLRRDEELARKLQEDESGGKSSPAPNMFTNADGSLKDSTKRRGRPTPKTQVSANVDLITLGSGAAAASPAGTPAVSSPATTVPPARPESAQAAGGFDDDAWTNRPSSTKPGTPAPAAVVSPRPPSAPPAPPPPPPPPAAPAVAVQPQATGLASKTEADVFDQLARLSALRTHSPAVQSPPPPPVAPAPAALSPPPAGYGVGMGMGSSPVPMGQHLLAQQTGMLAPQQQTGPRGPYAPVPGNQGLLQPLVPTGTGFPGMIPTRPLSSASPFANPPGAQPSFLQTQPTGFGMGQGLMPQQTGFQMQQTSFQPQPMAFQPQPTGFQPQPTGFQPQATGFQPQATGFQPQATGFQPQQTGMLMGGNFGQSPIMAQPTGFGMQNGSGFGGVQTSEWRGTSQQLCY
jgi:hypothetical protein